MSATRQKSKKKQSGSDKARKKTAVIEKARPAGRTPRQTQAGQLKRPSALTAAAKVLAETGKPMTTREMIEAMAEKGYWTSPGGATPSATLYSAMLKEVKTKGKDARFVKTERGKFGPTGK